MMCVREHGGRNAGEKRPVSGVFVGGRRPVWLVAERGRLLPHPAAADGPASAFTSFHNEDCQRVTLSTPTDKGSLRFLFWCAPTFLYCSQWC